MIPRFQTLAWYGMRVSGVVLTLAVTFHMFWNTVVYDDVDLTWDLIVLRYYNPWWRLFDLALLGFTIFHGFYGLRQIMVDHLDKRGPLRVMAFTVFHGLWLGLLAFGTYVIMSFPWQADTVSPRALQPIPSPHLDLALPAGPTQ
jgi:succinate dehydrogenase hydrophobic anchor subunit